VGDSDVSACVDHGAAENTRWDSRFAHRVSDDGADQETSLGSKSDDDISSAASSLTLFEHDLANTNWQAWLFDHPAPADPPPRLPSHRHDQINEMYTDVHIVSSVADLYEPQIADKCYERLSSSIHVDETGLVETNVVKHGVGLIMAQQREPRSEEALFVACGHSLKDSEDRRDRERSEHHAVEHTCGATKAQLSRACDEPTSTTRNDSPSELLQMVGASCWQGVWDLADICAKPRAIDFGESGAFESASNMFGYLPFNIRADDLDSLASTVCESPLGRARSIEEWLTPGSMCRSSLELAEDDTTSLIQDMVGPLIQDMVGLGASGCV